MLTRVETEQGPRWQPDDIELAKTMWCKGMSATQIVAKIGKGRTRNSIIGLAWRHGWSGGNPKPDPRKKRELKKGGRNNGSLGLKLSNGTFAKSKTNTRRIAEPPKPPTCEPVTLMDADYRQCRWVLGDPNGPDTLFCGAHRIPGGSFCEFHRRLAYQPPERRRGRNCERPEVS